MAGRRLTRREALVELGLGGTAIWLAGCGVSRRRPPAGDGSTLLSSYADPRGDGSLQAAAGVPLTDRQDLARRAPVGTVLCTIAHLTDAHVLDEQSPARVSFLRRLGPPFNSTFRPQEALTAQVLSGALRAIDLLRPDVVVEGGDLIDNAQSNELELALALLRGGPVDPDSGGRGYLGVQSSVNPDPLYYRPDLDAPRHPGMLRAATRRFTSGGLSAPWYPVLGDHDILVQGVLPPSETTREIALGTRAIWDLPAHLRIPNALSRSTSSGLAGASPDAFASSDAIGQLIEEARSGAAVTVPADPSRRQLDLAEVLTRLRESAAGAGSGRSLDYSFDVGARVRAIVLDLARRDGGSGGLVSSGQDVWLRRELARAAGRWVLVFCHQPLTSSEGGERLLALLDRDPHVLAAIWGHTHRNRVVARHTRAGGYWLIATCSLIDYPQQLRALRVREAANGAVALETWMLDHVPAVLGDISRELSYLDSQGGRPQGFAGGRLDRNVRLYKPAPGT